MRWYRCRVLETVTCIWIQSVLYFTRPNYIESVYSFDSKHKLNVALLMYFNEGLIIFHLDDMRVE